MPKVNEEQQSQVNVGTEHHGVQSAETKPSPELSAALVKCPRCGGDGGDRYLCGLCKGQGKVKSDVAREYRKNERR